MIGGLARVDCPERLKTVDGAELRSFEVRRGDAMMNRDADVKGDCKYACSGANWI